ncbi:MAG: class I SAM-dependent methyltransferase [Chlorobiaceae bacterium]
MVDAWNSPDKFNREASKWDENPQRRALTLGVAHAIIATIKPKKHMNALEFGCGTGLVTLEIAPLVKTLSAVDTSIEMLAVLQDKIKASGRNNIETRSLNLASASDGDFSEKSFDLIYSSMTLHHIDDTAGFLKRISRLLSPDGILAVADLDLEDGLFHDDPLEKVHPGFDRGELAALFYDAGLQVLSFETIYTINKTTRSGATEAYPVFLSVASRQSA